MNHREHGLELLVLGHVGRHGVGALAAHVDAIDLVLDGQAALVRLVGVHAAERDRLLLPVPRVDALDDSTHVGAAYLGGDHGAHGQFGGGVVDNVVVHRLHTTLSLQSNRSPSVRVDKDLLVLGRVYVEVLPKHVEHAVHLLHREVCTLGVGFSHVYDHQVPVVYAKVTISRDDLQALRLAKQPQ